MERLEQLAQDSLSFLREIRLSQTFLAKRGEENGSDATTDGAWWGETEREREREESQNVKGRPPTPTPTHNNNEEKLPLNRAPKEVEAFS